MMKRRSRVKQLTVAVVIAAAWGLAAAASIVSQTVNAREGVVAPPTASLTLDRSGRSRRGKASFYATRYAGRTMAYGTTMRLYSNNAASRSLPLGTTARVTNLKTGLSAVVTIRDRGPYVRGRIIDLSPATARQIGISRRQGLEDVEVKPLTIPLADGSVRLASLMR